MVETPESEENAQSSPEEEKKTYEIDNLVNKIRSGQNLESDEIVWLSKEINSGHVELNANSDWIKDFIPMLQTEMEKNIKKNEDSRDLRDGDRGELFTVSQVQRRAHGKGGQLGYQEWKQRDAQAAAQEANLNLLSKTYMAHLAIHKELPEGANIDNLIKSQEGLNISGWRHPMKKWRSKRTLKSLKKMKARQVGASTAKKDIQTFLASVTNGQVKPTSFWRMLRHPKQAWAARRQKKDLNKLINNLPSSELKADGSLMQGIEVEIARLEKSRGADKRRNKEIEKRIERLGKFKAAIQQKLNKRHEKYSARETKLKEKRGERVATAKERYASSARTTQKRDQLLQDTTRFARVLQTLEASGIAADRISELKEQYRQQIKDRKMDEMMDGLTSEQQQMLQSILGEKESRSAESEEVSGSEHPKKQTDERVAQPDEENADKNAEEREDKEDKTATVENEQKEGETYTPLKNIEYKHQVDGEEKTETYQGDAVTHSEQDDHYSIDLDKAQGEELDKACMATLAHIKESGKDSFRIDENTPVELYDSLVKAADASGMTIENQEELKEAMDKKREEQKEGHEAGAQDGKPKQEEASLSKEQRDYLMQNGLVSKDMTMGDFEKLKWSDLDKSTQMLMEKENLGQNPKPKEEEGHTEEASQRQNEPKTKTEELSLSEATKNIPRPEFNLETQRWNIQSQADFDEQISSLSPAEQKAAKEMRHLLVSENKDRDTAKKEGHDFDENKRKLYTKKRGEIMGKAYEGIKKERGIEPGRKEVQKRTVDSNAVKKTRGGASNE